MKMLQTNQQVKAVTPSCETCGGPHAYNDCTATAGQTQNVYAAGAYNQGGNSYQPQAPAYQAPTLAYQTPAPAYQAPPYQALVYQALIPQSQVVTNAEFSSYMKANDAILKNMQTITTLTISTNDLKNMLGITTRSGVTYKGPMIRTTSSPPKVVECETEVTKDTVPPTNNGSTEDVQPPVVQVKNHVLISEPVVDPFSALMPNPKPSIIDFLLLEEADAFLALEDDPTSPKVDHSYYDLEGDILLLEAFINDDPSLPPPTQGNYLP
ncbi:hypothetical protein Tco_1518301, partial [Tanacetum coccineum]